jgi:hypothetical protein
MMRRIALWIIAAMVLAGCATLAPPAGADASLIIGKLKVEVSGMGIATNQSNGWVRTGVPAAAALWIRNRSSGAVYEIRTSPDGSFMLANVVEPGGYSLVELWAQVRAEDAYVTITSDFAPNLDFDVGPGKVVNLGVNSWRFSYDLSQDTSANSFAFNTDFPSVESYFHRADLRSMWAGREVENVSFRGNISASPSAKALPPIMLPFG